MILFAQIITAAQMVYEEKYVVSNDIPPLQAVGWEGNEINIFFFLSFPSIILLAFVFLGVFGFLMMSVLLVPFYFIQVGYPLAGNNSRGVVEDFPEAINQIMDNKWILFALIGD